MASKKSDGSWSISVKIYVERKGLRLLIGTIHRT